MKCMSPLSITFPFTVLTIFSFSGTTTLLVNALVATTPPTTTSKNVGVRHGNVDESSSGSTVQHDSSRTVVQQKTKLYKPCLRMRTTQPSDLDDISRLLALAIMELNMNKKENPDNNNNYDNTNYSFLGRMNWKQSMDLWRTQSGMQSLLQSRMTAIREGHKVYTKQQKEIQLYEQRQERTMSSSDKLRLLWSCDSVRRKIEFAVQETTNEHHILKDHNFDLIPNDLFWLQHKMITAVHAESKEIVGYCEIAMLSRPNNYKGSNKENENNQDQDSSSSRTMVAVPTIMNLVISPKHRRRGIGSRLVETAERYVQTHWINESEELSLYVDKCNTLAQSMYQKLGFGTTGSVETEDVSQFYMTRTIKTK